MADKTLRINAEISKKTMDRVAEYVGRLAGPVLEGADILSDKIRLARHRYVGGVEIYYHGLEGHAPFGPGPEVRSTYMWQGSDFIKTVHLDEEQTAA